jgi:2-(1,2-epoxy-1,2-dihydrophenyl)acetyl-CoA isomerase
MFTGDKLSAEDALKHGLVYKLFSPDNLMIEAQKFSETIAQMPTAAIAQTKKLLNKSFTSNLVEQLKQEGNEQVSAAKSYDYNEGVTAFLEKRKPVFKGK